MLLNWRSPCPDVDLFNMIFHKLQSMTLKLNLCKITDGQFRWKGEEILLSIFQNLFPIPSFDSFTPWGRALGETYFSASMRNFSYLGLFFFYSFLKKILKYSQFTVFHQFSQYSKVTQSYIYIYTPFFSYYLPSCSITRDWI